MFYFPVSLLVRFCIFSRNGLYFKSLNQNIKVVFFPLNFWNTYYHSLTIFWSDFEFCSGCYYLKNKVALVYRFYKSPRIGKISKPAIPGRLLGFKTFPILRVCKIYYSHFIFEVMYHCWYTVFIRRYPSFFLNVIELFGMVVWFWWLSFSWNWMIFELRSFLTKLITPAFVKNAK